MAIFEKLFSKKASASHDARQIYQTLMEASRNPAFFGTGKVSDNYEGRLDILALHLSGLYSALRKQGEQGKRLAQAVYDVMVDDFDAALREEGLTDSGVKRRIKPMVSYVFARIKEFDDFQSKNLSPSRQDGVSGILEDFPLDDISAMPFVNYINEYTASLNDTGFRQIASGQIIFPSFRAG